MRRQLVHRSKRQMAAERRTSMTLERINEGANSDKSGACANIKPKHCRSWISLTTVFRSVENANAVV
jgi:hypothetical protein